jgi:hypothetical protein
MSYYQADGPATPRQLATLREILPPEEHGRLYDLTRQEAHAMLQARVEEWRRLPPTAGQEAVLRRNILYRAGMPRGPAVQRL